MSKIEVDAIEPQSGTSLTLGASGDTITIPSGATLTNSGTATGFGKVLQVISANNVIERATTSTSFVTASNTLTINITPSSASSKIYINVTSSMYVDAVGAAQGYFTIFRDATNLGGATSGFGNIYAPGVSDTDNGGYVALSILDEPNTTSAITYQVYIRTGNASDNVVMAQESTSKSTITAFEIAG
jgi:hypothetical protein